MCHETPATIVPRIVSLLTGETVAWTGNEILGRITAGDVPCETHFDEALRRMIREGALTSEEDAFGPTQTITTRCRLAYILAPAARTPTAVVSPPAPPEKPKDPTMVASPPPPPPPPPVVLPSLPSPAARLEAIGRLRDQRARVERDWAARFGPDCFRAGSPEFLKRLFLQARIHGLMPRLRDALEKSLGRRIDDFERSCQNLLDLNDRDGTIPVGVIDSGVKLDLMSYVAMDLDRAERDVHEGREGSPASAREILAFLVTAIDNPSLRPPATPPPPSPTAPARAETAPKSPPPPPAPKPAEPPSSPPASTAARKAMVSLVFWTVALVAAVAAVGILWPRKAVSPADGPPLPPVVPKEPLPERKAPETPTATDLSKHTPDARELDLLEQLLVLSRATLPDRIGYSFGDAAERIESFSREKIPPPWVEMVVAAERERIGAALRAFQARPLLEGKEIPALQLRDGRTLRGRIVSEIGGRLTLEANGVRQGLTLDLVHPTTFAVAQGSTLDAVRVRSAAGDATGALPLLAGLPEVERRRLAPLLLDQAIEEALRAGDPKTISGFEVPADFRATADALLPARMKALALEKDAAWALLHVDEGESLRRLLTSFAGTRSGERAARQALEAFEQALPSGERFELVGAVAWTGWESDTRDAAGGTVTFDQAKNVYVLSAPSLREQVRLLRKIKAAERGSRLRWSFGPGGSESAVFMVALSSTRWIEIGRRSLTVFRADREGGSERISAARKLELPERLSDGVIHVVPRAGLVLVYLNGRLRFALPEKDYAPAGGIQLGMSGGVVRVESLRVPD